MIVQAVVARKAPTTTRNCQECLTEGHMSDANFCRSCGARLPVYAHDEPNA